MLSRGPQEYGLLSGCGVTQDDRGCGSNLSWRKWSRTSAGVGAASLLWLESELETMVTLPLLLALLLSAPLGSWTQEHVVLQVS